MPVVYQAFVLKIPILALEDIYDDERAKRLRK